ncbi:response regulator [uncultured Devosia sp.]|uniref:response regulator n=1 Tax=uncultured Devosia sp. TaxID=211434 RepID=UPI0035C9E319
MAAQHSIEGRRVLVVEDEMIIVLLIEQTLLDLRAQVIGPAAWLNAALQLAKDEPIDAAILDINIRGGDSYGVADILAERGIPFVLCSGYSDWALAERHRDRPRLTKPYSSKDLQDWVLQLLAAPV